MASESTTEPAIDIIGPGDRLGPIEASLVYLTDAEKLELIERIARSIRSKAPVQLETDEDRWERQRRNRIESLAAIAALSEAKNDDGFSNWDHDKILYGSPR